MPSLHHGAVVIGVFLIVTGGTTAFIASSQLQTFGMCCVVLGAVMLILGLFWAMNSKNRPDSYSNEYTHEYEHGLFSPPPGNYFPESQSVFPHRTLETQRRGVYGEDFDYPPMETACFSPSTRGLPPQWEMEPPPPYEVAIKTTCSSTHLRRSYSDTMLSTEPLFGRSREISFEV